MPQLIVVCDFARFRVHDLANGQVTEFALADLHQHVRLFGFIAGYKVQTIQAQDPVNIRAAERMGRLHDALHASGYDGHPLQVLLVRLLFCLFADDTGIFQPAQALRQFIEERTSEDGSDLGPRLAQLFQVLNTPEDKRSKNLDEQLAAFPYINGKLFGRAPAPGRLQRHHAHRLARCLCVGLVGNFARHLRQPVPKHHGREGPAQSGGALHQ